MPRPLEVYGWTGITWKDPQIHGSQSRMIVAARSVAEVTRLAGIPRSEYMWSGCVTGNDEEVEQAMSAIGTVFWRGLNARSGSPWFTLDKPE